MSVLTISQSKELGTDVLLMIFQHLEGEDLLNCEAVCCQWRDILLAGTPWRRLFYRNKEDLPLWRKVQRKLETNQLTLRAEQYRDVCKKILLVAQNLCSGNFTKLTHPVDLVSCNITMSDDYVAWEFMHSRGCEFLDTESMEIKEYPLFGRYEHFNEMLVFWRDRDAGELEIVDPTNHWVIKVLEEEEKRVDHLRHNVIFGNKMLIFHYIGFLPRGAIERVKIWKIGHPPVLLKDECYKKLGLRYEMVDDRFIVATAFRPLCRKIGDNFHFISTETFEETRSLGLMKHRYEYDRGLLFYTRNKGVIRILDVTSGTHFNDLRLPFRSKDEPFIQLLTWCHYTLKDGERCAGLLNKWASSNSNVIVIGWRYWNKEKSELLSNLSVYDLKAAKKPNSDSKLLYTLQFQFDIDSFVMDESEIAFIGKDGKNQSVTFLKFADFNFAERKSPFSKANKDIEMKIIHDPYVE